MTALTGGFPELRHGLGKPQFAAAAAKRKRPAAENSPITEGKKLEPPPVAATP